jgi:hypothetical protein
MATVKNVALHAVSLPSGRVLAPGAIASSVNLADVSALVDAGLLSAPKPAVKKKPTKPDRQSADEQKEN